MLLRKLNNKMLKVNIDNFNGHLSWSWNSDGQEVEVNNTWKGAIFSRIIKPILER